MKFSTPIFALVATLLSCTTAAPFSKRDGLAFTNDNYQGVTVGTPLTLSWSGNDGAVTITLKSGSADNLETAGIVASGIWGSPVAFTPTTSGTYAFEISDASSTNYSPQFYVSAPISRRSNLSSDLKDAALYLPRLFARGVTSLLPRAKKAKEEPPALAEDGVPCWAVNGGMPDSCLDSQGKMYKSRTAQLTEVDSVRWNSIKHGAVTSYKPSRIDARKVKNNEPLATGPDETPCWDVIGGIPDVCLSPEGEVYHYAREQATEIDSARWRNLLYGAVKGTKGYVNEEEREKKGVEGREWAA